MLAGLRCAVCDEVIDRSVWNDAVTFCARCQEPLQARVYPAAFRAASVTRVDAAEEGIEAACFQHASNKAIAACARCGRFMCAVCDIEIDREHICPVCLESGARQGTIQNLDNRRTLYDSIAFALATLPVFTIYLPIFTAPAAVYLSIRYWRAPLSILPRTRWRFVLAALFGATQFFGLVAIIVIAIAASRSRITQ